MQVADALQATGTDEVWEFGAGSGALGGAVAAARWATSITRYTIVDLSGSLRERQREALAGYGDKVHWVERAARAIQRRGGRQRGARRHAGQAAGAQERRLARARRDAPALRVDGPAQPTLRPPVEIEGAHDYLTEIHPQAEAFIRTLADRLEQGAAFFIDYGFPEREYYHPQRHMGTLMCHRGHMADADPLADLGAKDITAHVNFTGIALAAQEAGLGVLGYTSQARFLINCGLVAMLEQASHGRTHRRLSG